MRQVAGTGLCDKSLHDMSTTTKEVAATSLRRLFVAHTECECDYFSNSILQKYMTLSHWLIYIFSQRFVADVYTRRDNAAIAHFVATMCRTTHRSDKILSQRHRLSQECTMSHGATCRSNLAPRHVFCCSDLSPSVSRPFDKCLSSLILFIAKYHVSRISQQHIIALQFFGFCYILGGQGGGGTLPYICIWPIPGCAAG